MLLLAGARPQNVTKGPKCRLGDALWEVSARGVKDTILRLVADFPQRGQVLYDMNGTPVRVEGPCFVTVEVVSVGSEECITVDAKEVS